MVIFTRDSRGIILGFFLFWCYFEDLHKFLFSFTLTFLLGFLVNFCNSVLVSHSKAINRCQWSLYDHLCWPLFCLLSLLNCDSLVENTFSYTRGVYRHLSYQVVLFRLSKTWARQLYVSCVHWALLSSISPCLLSPVFNQFRETETWGQMWWIEKCRDLFTCFCCSLKGLYHQFSSNEIQTCVGDTRL